jgi:hypothetical protein
LKAVESVLSADLKIDAPKKYRGRYSVYVGGVLHGKFVRLELEHMAIGRGKNVSEPASLLK